MENILNREEYGLAIFGHNNPKPYEEYLKEFLRIKINESYHPDPFRIDIIFEEDLEFFTVFVSQRVEGKYSCYLTQWDLDLTCIHEIELSPDVLELVKRNKDLIDKVIKK